jgi:hypothetical protein
MGGDNTHPNYVLFLPGNMANMKMLTPLPLETEVKGSILIPCKGGGPFLPLVEPEAASLPLIGVGLSTSQPPPIYRGRWY